MTLQDMKTLTLVHLDINDYSNDIHANYKVYLHKLFHTIYNNNNSYVDNL